MLGELVEEGVFAFVSGPDGHVMAPSDAALGGLPEELCVGMFGELVEAHVTAIDGHGLRMGGEGKDARLVVEFDVADFDFFFEGCGLSVGAEAFDFKVIFAVGDNGPGEVEEFGEVVSQTHVFQGTGVIFGGEEIIATGKVEAFAHVFEGVGISPTNADGFFSEGEGGSFLSMEIIFAEDPGDLVRHEVLGEPGVGIDFYCWENRAGVS